MKPKSNPEVVDDDQYEAEIDGLECDLMTDNESDDEEVESWLLIG